MAQSEDKKTAPTAESKATVPTSGPEGKPVSAPGEPPAEPQPPKEPPKPEPKVMLQVTFGPMHVSAMLSGRADPGVDPKVVQRDITNLLKAHSVRYGLSGGAVRQAIISLAAGSSVENLVIAQGEAPKKGRDAVIEPLVDLGHNNIGKQKHWGHIDFRDKGPLPVAEPGQPIARLIPAQRGVVGKDVMGRRILAPSVRMLRLRAGKGCKLTPDGRQLIASAKGIVVRPEEEKFEVLEVLEIAGDVNYDTGHIDFPGLVKVKGAILPDFKVTAVSLEAGTLEPGSVVELEGDLVVNGGVMGTTIRTGGSVKARFVRDSRITCGKDLLVDNEIVQSQVSVEGKVVVSSTEGRIVNSRVSALLGVSTQDLRCAAQGSTVITLGVRPEIEKELAQLLRAIEKFKKEEHDLSDLVTGQEDELATTEQEIRSMIDNCRAASEPGQRDNLMTQIQMLMPLRDTLKEGVDDGRLRLQDLACEQQRLEERILHLRHLASGGKVWAEVRGKADAGVEFRGPRTMLVLETPQAAFSVGEVQEREDGKLTGRVLMQAGGLRGSGGPAVAKHKA